MKLINIGFGNMINAGRLITIVTVSYTHLTLPTNCT